MRDGEERIPRGFLSKPSLPFLLQLSAALLGWSFASPAIAASAQPAVEAVPVPLLSKQTTAEWIFVYKFNASSFPTTRLLKECRFGGTPNRQKSGQAWAVASNAFPALTPGAGLIGTTVDDPIGATFNEIYNSSLNFITWNDQFYGDPRLKCGANCTGRWGHSKGLLAWDDLGNGVVMQVTTPDWPGAGSSAVPRPREGNTLGCEHATNNVLVGQHFFVLKLSRADTGAVLDALANASVATDPRLPQIARLGGPPELVTKARSLGHIVQSVTTCRIGSWSSMNRRHRRFGTYSHGIWKCDQGDCLPPSSRVSAHSWVAPSYTNDQLRGRRNRLRRYSASSREQLGDNASPFG